MTSFRVDFEKVGRGLLREGKRREGEWAEWGEARGDEEKLFFQNAREMTSHRCVLGRVDSAKKHVYYSMLLQNLAFSSFFQFLAQKMLKRHIPTSIWSA